jgi:protein involved in polysaccharide export with SLBB domain
LLKYGKEFVMKLYLHLSYLLAITLVVFAGLAGCYSNPNNIEAFTRSDQTAVNMEKYLLMPPDQIELFCAKIPEIHQQKQFIRPDGKISFEGLGELEVAGKTPQQATEMLREKAASLYSLAGDHPIDLRIAVYQSHYYYVLGEVTKSGPRVCTGHDTLFTALGWAHPEVTGWTKRVRIIRPSPDKKVKAKIFEANYEKMIIHGDFSKDVVLEDGDIVYVRPTILASIAMVIEEFVRPIGRALAPAVSVSQITAP